MSANAASLSRSERALDARKVVPLWHASRACRERLAPLALVAALSVACGPKGSPDAGRRPAVVRRDNGAPVGRARPIIQAGAGARVVVDVSESHQGFARGRALALEGLHGQVIESSLAAQGLNVPFERCALDEQLRCSSR
jgi:hypothetical protein